MKYAAKIHVYNGACLSPYIGHGTFSADVSRRGISIRSLSSRTHLRANEILLSLKSRASSISARFYRSVRLRPDPCASTCQQANHLISFGLRCTCNSRECGLSALRRSSGEKVPSLSKHFNLLHQSHLSINYISCNVKIARPR